MNQLIGIGQVSRLIGVARHRIEYAIVNGSLAEPTQRIGNRRAFSPDETNRIAKYFGKTIKLGEDVEKGGT